MKPSTILIPLLALALLFVPFQSYAQVVQIKALLTGQKYGCGLQSPANLLVSLANSSRGKVLVFKKEISSVSRSINKTRASISALRGSSDSKSKKLRKKINLSLTALRALKKAILECRDGLLEQNQPIICSDPTNSNGTPCDDLNPCTENDHCESSTCIGGPAQIKSSLKCGFGSCARTIEQCVGSQFITCAASGATSEICNGLDDDCNGEIDEGEACTTLEATPTAVPLPTPTAALQATPTPLVTGTIDPDATATQPGAPTATLTLTPINTATPTNTLTPTPSRTPTTTRTPTRTPTRTKTATPTPTSTPNCKPADNSGSNSTTGCACLGTFDCCGICSANGKCVGANRAPSGGDPGAALSCFAGNCHAADNSGNDNPTGCPCLGTFDCCGICSATSLCTGANRSPTGGDPGAAASCS